MVILAVLIVMVLGTFGTLVKSRQSTTSRFQAAALASQMIAEILQNRYEDPTGTPVFGPDPGEAGATRANFNDVDDYNSVTDSPPAAKDGTAFAGLTGWSRQVSVQYVDPDTFAVSGTNTGLKRISVTVTNPRGVKTTVVALRSSNGTYDQSPGQATTCFGWVGVELQVGSDSANRMVSGVNVLNVVP